MTTNMLRRALLALVVLPSAILAQQALTCMEHKPVTGDIGIGGFQCVAAGCSVNGLSDGQYYHSFSAEPYVWDIDPDGPSAGRLLDGDRIVAVDGMLVTTPAAGARLANLTPGETVLLKIRRGAQVTTLSLVPVRGCNQPYIYVTNDARRHRPPPGWKRSGPGLHDDERDDEPADTLSRWR